MPKELSVHDFRSVSVAFRTRPKNDLRSLNSDVRFFSIQWVFPHTIPRPLIYTKVFEFDFKDRHETTRAKRTTLKMFPTTLGTCSDREMVDGVSTATDEPVKLIASSSVLRSCENVLGIFPEVGSTSFKIDNFCNIGSIV